MESLLNLPVPHAIWYAIILLAASYIRGFSGFGFTTIFLTGLAFIMPVAEIVPLSIALEVAASSGQARSIRRDVKWRELGILLATGLVCTPIGIFFLGYFDDLTLRSLVLGFIFLSCAILIFVHMRPLRLSSLSYTMAGAVIGIINGAAALSGLVLALFFSLSDERAVQMRATMIAYLFAADLWTFALLFGAGYYDSATISRVAISLPLLAIGVWLGSLHFASSGTATYRKAVLWLLLALSAIGLAFIVMTDLV